MIEREIEVVGCLHHSYRNIGVPLREGGPVPPLSLMDSWLWDGRCAQAAAHAAAGAPGSSRPSRPLPCLPARVVGRHCSAALPCSRRVLCGSLLWCAWFVAGDESQRATGRARPARKLLERRPRIGRGRAAAWAGAVVVSRQHAPMNSAVGRTGVPSRGASRYREGSTPRRDSATMWRGLHSKARYGLESAVVPVRSLGHSLLACLEKRCA